MSSYVKGRRAEYYVIQIFRKGGFRVLRSAKSGTPIDFIAGKPSKVYAVQVKKRYMPEKEKRELIEWARAFSAIPLFVVLRRGGYRFYTLSEREGKVLEEEISPERLA